MPPTSRVPGLRDLPVEARRKLVAESAGIDPQQLAAFAPERGMGVGLADHMIENVVGVLGVPLGVATNFVVNGREVLVPMASEEASVVAAASNAAKVARIHAHQGEPCPRCGTVLEAVFFEDYVMTYCPQCQTEGRVLKDRRLSRLLK